MEKKQKEATNDWLTNLNMDPALSGYIKHMLDGDMSIGSKRGEHTDITLPGNIDVDWLPVINVKQIRKKMILEMINL